MKLKRQIVAFTMLVGAVFAGVFGAKVDVKAEDVPYYKVYTAEEMNAIKSTAAAMQYNKDYQLAGKTDLEYNYKFTVSQKGYLTFYGDNPFLNAEGNGLLQPFFNVIDANGNCLWRHYYDLGDEPAQKHGYKIGLNPGTYYFSVTTGLYSIKNTTATMKYSFAYTPDIYFETEPNNTKETANVYTLGTTVSGEYSTRPYSFWGKGPCDDFFKITLQKGKTYIFKGQMEDGGLGRAPDFRIEDANGEKVFGCRDFKNGQYTFVCPATGIYYFRAGTDLVSASGSVQKYSFSVNEKPIKVNATSIKKITPKKKSATVTWKKKSGVNGYQIQYSTSKAKIEKGKKVKVKGASKKSVTIKKLKSKKVYYFRIRSYKKVKGKTYYSEWSKVKKSKKIK